MTGKNRRHYHCKALNSLLCADVPLRNYSLTHADHGILSQATEFLFFMEFLSARPDMLFELPVMPVKAYINLLV